MHTTVNPQNNLKKILDSSILSNVCTDHLFTSKILNQNCHLWKLTWKKENIVLSINWEICPENWGFLRVDQGDIWLKSPQKGAKNYREHYPPKDKILRIVIWHIFWKIWAKNEKKKLSEINANLIWDYKTIFTLAVSILKACAYMWDDKREAHCQRVTRPLNPKLHLTLVLTWSFVIPN